MSTKASWLVALSAALAVPAGQARAAAGDEAEVARPAVSASAAAGSFLAFTNPAALDRQSAYATGTAGYDSARGSGIYEAAAEVRLWGPVSLRGGAVYTQEGERRLRPSFGARVQALRESKHGVDGSFGVFYRPEGLTEPEGELEAVMAAGTHVGATYLLGNLVYGQDPEGNERDGELRLAALHPVASRVLLGLDSRLRFDLGTSAAKREPTLDALVGPAATILAGPLAFLVHAGASAFRLDSHTATGVFVLGGLGTSF
jgi:hypothetical protein